MPLSETVIRQTKAESKAIKLFDGRGLFLIIKPNGARGWRFKYRIDGREKLLSFGVYPDVPLKLARDRREAARQQLASGIDPGTKATPSRPSPVSGWRCKNPSSRRRRSPRRLGRSRR